MSDASERLLEWLRVHAGRTALFRTDFSGKQVTGTWVIAVPQRQREFTREELKRHLDPRCVDEKIEPTGPAVYALKLPYIYRATKRVEWGWTDEERTENVVVTLPARSYAEFVDRDKEIMYQEGWGHANNEFDEGYSLKPVTNSDDVLTWFSLTFVLT